MKRPFFIYSSILLLLLAVLSGTMLLKASGRHSSSGTKAEAQTTVADAAANLTYGSFPDLGKSSFYALAREKLISDNVRFVEADLSGMKIRVYDGANVILEVPIKTKGREGSWWQTPVGLYKVESKERNHFSSFGKVYQPWSMAFQGNFFIHGWPYYPSGEPVSSQYSGGCVRLTDEDAEEIYKLVEVGTPVLVFEEADANDGFAYEKKDASFDTASFLVADTKNNQVLAAKNSNEALPMGTTAHLLAALVTVEYTNIEHNATVPDDVPSDSRLIAGEEISIYDLLHLVLGEGDEDALHAIASSLGTKRFVSLMNTKAAAIGMRSTHIASINADDGENRTTAEDLFALGRYLANNRSFILRLTHESGAGSAYGASTFENLTYDKQLVGLAGFVGGVRDTVPDGNAVGIFNVKIGTSTRSVFVTAIGTPESAVTIADIRAWLQKNYE